ncbi:MAG: hypothetical protein EHM64_01665 [Ignavibacteriae bacterium]|nr:MAG: hypothetical protein EHM64_01665 [Ignavibacteriota bacterium]
MNVFMDIMMASVFGGVITMITINANLVIREAWAGFNSQLMVQQMLISNAQIVESEFRNMGCGLDVTVPAVTMARDTCIEFRMSLRPDPQYTPSTIKYYSGAASELTSTDNPDDRFLYRQQDGGALERVGIITKFNMVYYTMANDTIPTPVADPGSINIIEVTMEVQNPFVYFIDMSGKKHYASALWKQTRLASQNLRR